MEKRLNNTFMLFFSGCVGILVGVHICGFLSFSGVELPTFISSLIPPTQGAIGMDTRPLGIVYLLLGIVLSVAGIVSICQQVRG
jgi:hypothetical protein